MDIIDKQIHEDHDRASYMYANLWSSFGVCIHIRKYYGDHLPLSVHMHLHAAVATHNKNMYLTRTAEATEEMRHINFASCC